jgi:acyl dehydratase
VTGQVERRWEDVAVGDALIPISFPLSLYRLVVVAGANRDFNSIHHNSEYARATGAADAYANTLFLQGMWERAVREYIGDGGTIRAIRGFRMRSFNVVGDTAVVEGEVSRRWLEGDEGYLELTVRTSGSAGVTVGPGTVIATMPRAR